VAAAVAFLIGIPTAIFVCMGPLAARLRLRPEGAAVICLIVVTWMAISGRRDRSGSPRLGARPQLLLGTRRDRGAER